MNKFTTGMVAGGIIGAIGLTYAMQDKKTRKRVMRDSRRVADKASNAIEHLTDMM